MHGRFVHAMRSLMTSWCMHASASVAAGRQLQDQTRTLFWADPDAPVLPPLPPLPPCLPAHRYDFFSGQEAVLGAHEAGAKCVEWLPTRGLLATAGWDRCGEGWAGCGIVQWAASACIHLTRTESCSKVPHAPRWWST